MTIPGGKLEASDANCSFAAALRELQEEAGLAPRLAEHVSHLTSFQFEDGKVRYVVDVFKVSSRDLEPAQSLKPNDQLLGLALRSPIAIATPNATDEDQQEIDMSIVLQHALRTLP